MYLINNDIEVYCWCGAKVVDLDTLKRLAHKAKNSEETETDSELQKFLRET